MNPDHIRGLFLQELEEQTRLLSQGLLELESGARAQGTLDRLFRAAHSLKGAAQVTGARAVADVAHGIESVLSAIRAETLAPGPDVITATLAAVDWLASASEVMSAGADPEPRPARRLRRELDELAGDDSNGAEPALTAPAAGPASETVVQPESMRAVDVVRVAADKLDSLLQQASEITVARQRLEAVGRAIAQTAEAVGEHDAQWIRLRSALDSARRAGLLPSDIAAELERADETWSSTTVAAAPLVAQVNHAQRDLRQATAPLLDSVLDLRTMPFAQVCQGLDRIARDLTHRSHGKHVALTVEGGAVELDRSVALAVREPLIHLVHNAVDHGIEASADRETAGKRPTGEVRLTAELRGGVIEISVRDDGAGLPAEALRSAAAGSGLGHLDDFDDLVRAAFTPGLSTAQAVTETSGRGVGLDAVRARIDGVGGSVRIASEPGTGTTVTLTTPVTLSILHTLTVAVGKQIVMLTSAGVQRVIDVERDQIRTIGGRPNVLIDDRHVPLIELADILGWQAASSADRAVPTVVVEAVGAHVGLTVSALLGEGEVVVNGLGQRLAAMPAAVGATLLPGGGIAMILSAVGCAQLSAMAAPSRSWQETPSAAASVDAPRILLAEDTMTTRVLQQGILEGAGYEVVPAVDGADAWQKLRDRGADLVVSDINMPGMDGLELCTTIRRSRRFADLPVVLVTSLADEDDRRRGLEAGANAYIVKSGFDQDVLLATIARLLP